MDSTTKEKITLRENNPVDLREKKNEKNTPFFYVRKAVLHSKSYFFAKRKNIFTLNASNQISFFLGIGGLLLFFLIIGSGTLQLYKIYQSAKNTTKELQSDILPHSLASLKKQDYIRLSLNFSRANDLLLDLQKYFPNEETTAGVGVSPTHSIGEAIASLSLLIEAGNGFTDVLDNMNRFFSDYKQLPVEELKAKYKNLTTFLNFQWKYLQVHSFEPLKLAKEKIQMIDVKIFPETLRLRFDQLKSVVFELDSFREEGEYLFPKFLSLLGEDYPRTYVVLLQNSSEVRATGGFIGSLAFIRINNGWIQDIKFKDVYEFDGQFFQDVPPPPGIEKISAQFRLRDANYWPDFPTSAKQIMWFLDKEKGPGVDGVFAITDNVIKDLLLLTGPILLDDVNISVNSKNFSQVMSYLVESKLNKKNPKGYLFIFAENLMQQAKKSMFSLASAELLLKEMNEKQILAFSSHKELEEIFQYFSVSGEMLLPKNSKNFEDYLLVAHTAIGANKSDQYIKERIEHSTKPLPTDQIEDTLSVTRTHTWSETIEKDLFPFLEKIGGKKIDEKIAYILGKGNNSCYMRFYVPEDAELVSVVGVNRSEVAVYEDLGRKVFALTMNVLPGEEKMVRLTYRMNMKKIITKNDGKYLPYYFIVEKQPGMNTMDFTKRIELENGWVVVANDHTDSLTSLDSSLLSPLEQRGVKNKELFPYLFFNQKL